MSIHLIGVVGLIAVFLVGTTRAINLGALALVMTFVVGSAFAGESARDLLAGFPVDLFLLLTGVTYLFAIASSNGTVERIVEAAARLFGSRRSLIPWVVFVVAALPALAGALGSAGVALLAPIALRLARRYDIDRRMIGLMVVHGASAGNFSPLNVLGIIVRQAVTHNGFTMSAAHLFLSNLLFNVGLALVVYVMFGGLRLGRAVAAPRDALVAAGAAADVAPGGLDAESWKHDPNAVRAAAPATMAAVPSVSHNAPYARLRPDQVCTLLALGGMAVAALAFNLNIGFLAFSAAVLLQLLFPRAGAGAEQKIAWGVVLLVCGIVTYVAALQRYGTVEVVGTGIARLGAPLLTALLLCAVGAVTSAFASSAGILGAIIPLAVPFMDQGVVSPMGLIAALAISVTVVDGMPFSTVGALVVANADDEERSQVYRGLLWWGTAMVITAPLATWLIFILPGLLG